LPAVSVAESVNDGVAPAWSEVGVQVIVLVAELNEAPVGADAAGSENVTVSPAGALFCSV